MARKQTLSAAPLAAEEEQRCVGLVDSPLEKILFPTVAVKRATGDDDLPLPLSKARLTFTVDGSLQSKNHPVNGHAYAVVKLKLQAVASEAKSGSEVVAVALTCLGYFRCDKSHSLDDLDAYLENGHEDFATRAVGQIYPAASLEFDRLVRQTGLPSMNISLSAPTKLKVAITETAAPAKPQRRTAASKRATPAKQGD